jgi:ATP-binding cassette subfamily B protein
MNNRRSPASKPKNFKKAIINLFGYCKDYYRLIIFAIVLSIISSIFSIIGPGKVRDIINEITIGLTSTINMEVIKDITLFLAVMYVLGAIFHYVEAYLMAIMTNKLSKNLRNKISVKINKIPLKYFDSTSYGDILSRVTNDVDTISRTLSESVSDLVSSIVLFIGVVLVMFITNPVMAITGILASLIGFSLLAFILAKSQKYYEIQQKELGNLNGHIEEAYSGHNVVKVYNNVENSKDEFEKINEKMFNSSIKSHFLSGLMPPIMGFIGNFGYVAICIVGSILVINGKINVATIVSFMMYTRLFTSPLSTIAQGFIELQSAAAASERVSEFLSESELEDESSKTLVLDRNKVEGNIEFNHVVFGYDDDKNIIKDFNVSVEKGEKVAIVGPTGAGKTTMVNLLMRFYEIKNGSITIDGVNTKDITRENVHDLFCMVLQDTWVFEGTIKENIIYNRKNITDNEVEDACRVVGLDHFIKTLPLGYDTVLGDIESLSAGQKQLLTIARGMLSDAPFLILDEATSSVDTRTEELVQKAMDALTKGRTSFIIAHRLSTIKNADLILVMKDGNIIEQGSHNELMEKNGFYTELYNSQFQN